MLGYLSKFVLQMLPTISATVIGAYIVTTWINPKTPPAPAKIATQAPHAAKASPAAEPAAQDAAAVPAEVRAEPTPADAKSVEAKPVDAKSADTAEGGKPIRAAKGPDSIRIIPIVRQPAPATEVSVAAPETMPATIDERRDANELARAAIQRLRGGSEAARAAEEPARPAAPAVRVHQARAVQEAPQALQHASPAAPTASAPPLPPAVSIAAPRYPQADAAEPASFTQPDRMTPPGEIPATRAPLQLQATHRVAENPSLADDFVSATKSFFRAITPQ